MEYSKLVKEKTYDEMTKDELNFCIITEINFYRPKIEKLKKENVPNYKIAAYIYDLWQDYLIADDAKLANAYNISDDDWEKGLYDCWFNMIEPNPLVD